MGKSKCLFVILALNLLIVPVLTSQARDPLKPNPSPSPRPSPSPEPDIAHARQVGLNEGQVDGRREGDERGETEGGREGLRDGQRTGFDRCQREERQHAYDHGFSEGFTEGERLGRVEGTKLGRQNGEREGRARGHEDGLARADREANRDATPRGREQGYSEADVSNARELGAQEGREAGARRAYETAQREAYPQGRLSYRSQRFAEPIENHDEFSQHSILVLASHPLRFERLTLLNARAVPDNRHYHPSRHYSNRQEQEAYLDGYRSGYGNGFRTSYDSNYERAYRMAHERGEQTGCEEARRGNYRDRFEDGWREGRARGFERGQAETYQPAFEEAFAFAFSRATEAAYRDRYPDAYRSYFEAARAEAYRIRYGQLYQAAYAVNETARFEELYPELAAEAFARGEVDEANDFVLRPLRGLRSQVSENDGNGLYEPGELLRLEVELRNFSEASLAKENVLFTIEAFDTSQVILSTPQESLVQDLKPKSVTWVKKALEFRVLESAVNKRVRLRLTVTYQGRNVYEKVLEITPNYLLGLGLKPQPDFDEGLETSLWTRATNNSQLANSMEAQLELNSDPQILEIRNSRQFLGSLAALESRITEFRVIARRGGAHVRVPIELKALATDGRILGLYDSIDSYPVQNDYQIEILNTLGALRNPGVVRVGYRIQNRSSSLINRSLQLSSSFKGDASTFEIIGPNPQYLTPIPPGESRQFAVLILVKSANSGGTLVLEVQEDGQAKIIHEKNF